MIRNGRPTFLSLGVATLLSFMVATATVYLFMAAGRGQLPVPIIGQIFSPAGIGEIAELPAIQSPRPAEQIPEGTPVAGPFLVVGGSIAETINVSTIPVSMDSRSTAPLTTPIAAQPIAALPVPAAAPQAPVAASNDQGAASDGEAPPVVATNDDNENADEADSGQTKKKKKGKNQQDYSGAQSATKKKSPGDDGNGHGSGHGKDKAGHGNGHGKHGKH
jgi:hypothetical protein